MPRRDTPRLSMRDREVLNSIRTQSWWNSQPITEKQQALVNRIDGTLQNLDTLVGEFAKFSRSLNNPVNSAT